MNCPVGSLLQNSPLSLKILVIQMGYPVNVDLGYLPPGKQEHLQRDFDRSEEILKHTSIKHVDAIKSTNLGLDWLALSQARGDRGQL